MSTQRNYCATCRYRRRRQQAALFSASDLQTPGVLKQHIEWQQQQRQRTEQEAQRFASGLPFTYEPHSYDWCEKFTADLEQVIKAQEGDQPVLDELMEKGAIELNPVTGEISLVYALCAEMNPEGECQAYEPNS